MNDGIGVMEGSAIMGDATNKTPFQLRQAVDERMSAGYTAAGEGLVGRRRDERLAATFREDPRMERLLELRRTDRAAFDHLPSGAKMSLGFYLSAKEAHEREGTRG